MPNDLDIREAKRRVAKDVFGFEAFRRPSGSCGVAEHVSSTLADWSAVMVFSSIPPTLTLPHKGYEIHTF
jgi:hypothetical protein